MRAYLALLLSMPTLLSGQSLGTDEGRLESAWFGPSVVFQPSKALGLLWLKPGLDLQGRTLRLRTWEPAVWLAGKPQTKDQVQAVRMEGSLLPDLAKGLRRGLKGALPVSLAEGDLMLLGRVVDVVGEPDDGVSFGGSGISFDLKLVDGDSGELLGAFHETLKSATVDGLAIQYSRWCEALGKQLAAAVRPGPVAKPAPPPTPAFDLEGALRRIDGLKRDGLLTEEEYQALRSKAAKKAH